MMPARRKMHVIEDALALYPGFVASQGALCASLIQDGPRLAQARHSFAERLAAIAA